MLRTTLCKKDPYYARGPEDLKAHLVEHLAEHPNTTVEIKRAMAEGDLVFLLIHERHDSREPGHLTTTMFRIENGKIAEHCLT